MSASEIPASSRIHFGIFEVDLEARELRKRGVRIRLQDQPFQVLAILLERPGQIVTREQLQARLWSDGTFVDFDQAVNKAINRIREALGDVAATPRFIETVSKRGYRFIAPIDQSPAGASPGRRASPTPGQRVVRSSLLPPPNTSFLPAHFALSPDGTRLAFVAAGPDRKEVLYVRDLSGASAQQLNGTDGAGLPFWSPDSRRLGFFAGGKLKTIDIAGGAVRLLCDASVGVGGAWSSDDVIIFAGHVTGPLYGIAASGGTPKPATPIPGQHSSQLHCWPVFIPGSDRFLYFINRTGPQDALCNGIYAGSLGSTEACLVSPDIDGNLGFACGHVFFVRNGALYAQPFNVHSLQLTGTPIAIVQNELEIWGRAFYQSGFSVSDSPILVFQSNTDFSPELVWTDASGNECGRIPQSGYGQATISPDGRFVAISSNESHAGRSYICIHDLERGITTRLTDGGSDWHPSWSADGKKIIYDSTEGHTSSTYEIPADGSGPPRLLLEPGSVGAHSSPDGSIVFGRVERGGVTIAVKSSHDGQTVMLGPGIESQVSPDGKWLAFTIPGGLGICVLLYPGPGPRFQISSGPAAQPRWSRDGRQLFYIAADKKLMAVDFDTETGRASAPRPLFQTRIIGVSLSAFRYDVAPDGRFLINSLPSGSPPLTLLTGWTDILRQ
jgi:DNA-binding winged helix-turn-helix (wHTH) protein